MMMTLAQAAAWIPGARIVGDPETPIERVHTDTRTLAAGDLFVALKGERFDANAFLADAKASGASAAIAHGGLEAAGLPGLEVADTLVALGQLSAGWRAQFSLPLIAVTGSNGKTTVTQMISSILIAACDDKSLATAGNFNNEIGVPLTLLRLRSRHQRAVVEMGMNHPGEIARLAVMAQPTIALVNNAQREHLEFMESVEAVARENGAVVASLPDGGTAVFPHGDAYTALWTQMAREGATRRFMSFGENVDADISLNDARWEGGAWDMGVRTPLGTLRARLHIAGRHNVVNALAASACALATGVSLEDIAVGLTAFRPVKGRSRAIELHLQNGHEVTLIDDSYNANPDSVRAAIDVLADLPGPRLLVLGDMGEVGEHGQRFHQEMGAYARERGIETLLSIGVDMVHAVATFNAGGNGNGAQHFFDDVDGLSVAVLERLPSVSSVLVKGSRFMKMERVAQSIVAYADARQKKSGEAGHVE